MKFASVLATSSILAIGFNATGFAQTVPDAVYWTGKPMVGPQAPLLADVQPAPSRPSTRVASDGGYNIVTSAREGVRLFYKSIFTSSNTVPDEWSGNIATCSAGDTSEAFKSAMLRRINWHRAMAGIPANVTLDATFSQKAQQSALMMSANRSLSHFPPTSWLCYSAAGAEAAGKSNIGYGTSGAGAVSMGYMEDGGSNNTAVGHRRWLLYPQTLKMGVGNVVPTGGNPSASTIWVQDGNYGTARPAVRDDFVAWPPKGYVPYAAVYPRWSFSYPNADFTSASVTVTKNGSAVGVRMEAQSQGYGENTVVWFPDSVTDGMDWPKPAADTVYAVTLSNVTVGGQVRSFSYNVTVFDPDTTGSDTPDQTPQGNASLGAGELGSFAFSPVAAATEHQWRSVSTAAATLQDGAESGTANFTVSTSAGYNVVTSDAAASGSNSFHLAHVQPTDQILALKQSLVPSSSGSLHFDSRLGLAASAQLARVEVSSNEGADWVALYEQAGQQSGSTSSSGETSFTARTVSLAAYAGKTVQLRFRYAFSNGSYYPQSSRGAGWYIDNISLSGVDAVTAVSTPASTSGSSFGFTAPANGTVLLQVRPGMYGYFGDWGGALRVGVSSTSVVKTPVTITTTDCLLNWAERAVPSLLAPATTTRSDIPPYLYRFYTASNTALAVSSADSHVYFYTGSALQDLGHQSQWLAQAGCQ